MNKLLKSSIGLVALAQLSIAGIIIAPPPMAYSPLKEIGSQTSAQFNYLSFETDASETTGIGVGISHRIRKTEDTFHNMSFYYMNMSDDGSANMESGTDIYNASYQYGTNINPQLLGFVGGSLNYSAYWKEEGYGTSNYSDSYIDTLMYSATAGLQYEHDVSFGVLIPWVAMTYIIGGSSDLETIPYGNDPLGNPLQSSSSSSDIDSFGAYQLGFDVYFDAIATSLSSMYQSSDDGDLLSLSLSYNF